MATRFLTFVGLLAFCGSGMAGVTTYAYHPFIKTYTTAPAAYVKSAPLVAAVPAAAPVVKSEEIDPHPQYNFAYDVHDSVTGDIKNQVESRDGENVAGAYSVVDADGYKRTVTYTADDLNGFNAVVQRDPLVAKAFVATAPVQAATLVQPVPASPLVKTVVQTASPAVQATPLFKAYAAVPAVATYSTPVLHTASSYKSYTAAPVLQSAPTLTTFSPPAAIPFVRSPYLASVSAQQFNQLPLQLSSPYFSSPAISVQQQEEQKVNEIQAHKEISQAENEPTAEQEEQGPAQQYQQQQLIQEQQKLFAQQQQQFAAQQQQVILQQQHLVEQQQQFFQQQQQQFANNQQYPPYPQYEISQAEESNNNDSEVVEGPSNVLEKQQTASAGKLQQNENEIKSASFSTTVTSVPVSEKHKASA